ncbi:MAG: PilX N-terminal domain-containing pilus assembly protein [Pseudomonadota bacterium]
MSSVQAQPRLTRVYSLMAASPRWLALVGRKQQGIALFISLVLLLVLTIVGVSSVQSTSLEERMARNAHDSVLAFQAAESALRQAETWLLANAPLPGQFTPAGANGLWETAPFGVSPRWEDAGVWTGTTSVQVPVALQKVDAQPRYIIEYVATVVQDDNPFEVGRGAGSNLSEEINVFRVTARGVGGSANAQVLLQSSFGMQAP